MSLSALLTSTREVHTVVQRALKAALTLSDHDQGSIMLAMQGARRLAVRAVAGQDPALVGTVVPTLQYSIAGWVLRNRRALYLEGHAKPPSDLEVRYTKDVPSSICLPLLIPPGKAIGVLNLNALRHPVPLSPGDIEVLQAVANHAAIAIDNAQLYDSLRTKEEQLQRLATDLVQAQEEERRRVAYEIHDGLAQVLVGTYQRLQACTETPGLQPSTAKQGLRQVEKQLKECIEEVRRVIADLRPTTLDDFGLDLALRRHLAVTAQEAGWDLEFRSDLQETRLPAHLEAAAFRIVLEAVNNARKHARSRRLSVSIKCRRGRLCLEVQDWGIGVPPRPPAQRRTAVGLISMEERATALGGGFALKSRPRRGTRVLAWLPLPEESGG